MIHWKIVNSIGYIQIDSPNKNALGLEDLCRIQAILEKEIILCKGVIITGTGYSFCSGLDLSGNIDELINLLDDVLSLLYSLSIPYVCALNGHAIGAGFLMMCCADYIVSVENDKAKFGLPEVSLGIVITKLMYIVLLNKLHKSSIRKLLLSFKLVNLDALCKLGMIDEMCCGNESLLERANNYIFKIDANNFDTYKECKQLFLNY